MKKKRETIIQPKTISEAKEIYEYIKINSPQNAEKFRQEFLNSIDKVKSNPDGCPPEDNLNGKRILYRQKRVKTLIFLELDYYHALKDVAIEEKYLKAIALPALKIYKAKSEKMCIFEIAHRISEK